MIDIDQRAKADAQLLDGCHVLETDVSAEHMDASTVDERYRSLQPAERELGQMKTGLGRPMRLALL